MNRGCIYQVFVFKAIVLTAQQMGNPEKSLARRGV
jgi:hypothetical protein